MSNLAQPSQSPQGVSELFIEEEELQQLRLEVSELRARLDKLEADLR